MESEVFLEWTDYSLLYVKRRNYSTVYGQSTDSLICYQYCLKMIMTAKSHYLSGQIVINSCLIILQGHDYGDHFSLSPNGLYGLLELCSRLYSSSTLRKPRSPLILNGKRGFLRVNRLCFICISYFIRLADANEHIQSSFQNNSQSITVSAMIPLCCQLTCVHSATHPHLISSLWNLPC